VTVDTNTDTGSESSLTQIKARPAIAYIETGTDRLRYARASSLDGNDASVWTTETVETATVTAPSLVELFNGAPGIAYHDGTNVKWAVGQTDGSIGTPTLVTLGTEAGAYISAVVLDNGFPAIAVSDAGASGLVYYVSSTKTGSQASDWSNPVLVDSTATAGDYLSLAVINGVPAISYYESVGGDLLYAVSDSADGKFADDWTSVTVDSTGDVGLYTSLFEVDGSPAISYYDGTNTDLKYAYASTSTGSSAGDWSDITVVSSTNAVGRGTSLKVVDGAPAIAYYDFTDKNLLYVSSATTDGASASDWDPSHITVDFPLFVGNEPSLAVINDGRPAISYYDESAQQLKYAVAVERAQNPSFLGASGSCPSQCSGHGYCGPNSICECFYRWTGNDCSERVCKEGLAWVDGSQSNAHSWAECSNKGICDRETGECVCFDQYTGAACERSVCPNDCSGHGQCEFIHELSDHDATNWDYWKIQGCRCDGDWTGVDCSQRICPWGDDPLTTTVATPTGDSYTITVNQNATAVEAQFFLEIDDLNGVTHRSRAFDYYGAGGLISTTNFEAALLDIPAIKAVDSVTVVETTPNELVLFGFRLVDPLRLNDLRVGFRDWCTDAGCYPKQTAQDPEDLSHEIIESVTVQKIIADPLAESAECSNRGRCNKETGSCECFEGHYGLACQHQTILV